MPRLALVLVVGLVLGLAVRALEIPSARGGTRAQFLNWLSSSKIEAKKCALHTFPGGLRGILATDSFAAGETIMRVPLDKCFVSRGDEDGKWPVSLALQLLSEMDKGKESAWWPYLAVLPQVDELRSVLPMHWEAEELEEGFGETDLPFDDDVTLAIEQAWTWRDFMWTDFRYNSLPDESQEEISPQTSPPAEVFSVQNRKLITVSAPPDKSIKSKSKSKSKSKVRFTRPEFEHALDLVQTRNCCPEPSLHAVVPFFDLLNHDDSARTVISLVGDDKDMVVELKTLCPIAKNSQVFLNYNLESQLSSPFVLADAKGAGGGYPMDTSAYSLVSYGFQPARLNQLGVLLPLETIRAALLDANNRVLVDSAYEPDGGTASSRPGSALAICQACGLQLSQPFTIFHDGISLSLLAVLRVLSASEEERQRLWGTGTQAMRDDVLSSSASALTAPVKTRLIQLLGEERARLADVLEQDRPGAQRPQRARKDYATSAISVLDDCLAWANNMLP